MKTALFIPQLNQEVIFDFMNMVLDDFDNRIKNEPVISFILKPEDSNLNHIHLGIHFSTDEFAIDEHYPNHRFTTIEDLRKIELYDFNLEFLMQNDVLICRLIKLAKTMIPRRYKLIQKTV